VRRLLRHEHLDDLGVDLCAMGAGCGGGEVITPTKGESTEEWREIAGYPDYMVSNLGRVYSLPRSCRNHNGDNGRRACGGLILRGSTKKENGRIERVTVQLFRDEKKIQRPIHHLVLEAFVGKRPSGLEGCHNDGDPTNNRLDNLRWDSHVSNIMDCVKHGTHTTPWPRGEKHPRAKLTNDQVKKIREVYTGVRGHATDLAKEYGVARQSILAIVQMRMRLTA